MKLLEFGIAHTCALGVGFYAVCAAMIVVARRADVPAPVSPVTIGDAPSILPAQTELGGLARPARVNEAVG